MTAWELLSIKIFLVKVKLEIGQVKYLLLIVLKTNPWTYKIDDLKGKRIVVAYIINELLSRIKQSY